MLPVIVPCLLKHISVNLFDNDDHDDENVWVTSLKDKLIKISLYSFCEVLKD